MRHLIIFLSIALLGNATAQTFGLYTYEINADNVSVTITDYDTSGTGALVIVDTLGGYPVTSIGSQAFRDCRSLTSITISNSVTNIGTQAFRDCTGLTSITIGNSVTRVHQPFMDCSSLTSIVVAVDNPNYSSIGPLLLNKNGTVLITAPSASGDFTIPDTVTSIGYSAFGVGAGLTSVTIPDSVINIGYNAFSGCTGLTSVTIPDSVTSIADRAFFACSSLTSIVVAVDNPNYSSIGPLLLNKNGTVLITGAGASGDFTIPDSVTSIGDWAFSRCNSLTSITIPDSVTSIGDHAFLLCKGLTSIIIPDSVTSIGSGAFSSCSSLTSIVVAVDNPNYSSIGPLLLNKNGTVLLAACASGDFTIPDTVTSIGDSAFGGCTGLTSITIPDSVTSIGDYAFSGCTGLTSVTIPDSVTSIGDLAFLNCTGLRSITIPNSVTSIGSQAFDGTNLSYFDSDGLKYVFSDNYAFLIDGSSASGDLSLPSNVDSKPVRLIAGVAFQRCKGLTSITIPDSVTSIGKYAFSSRTSIGAFGAEAQNALGEMYLEMYVSKMLSGRGGRALLENVEAVKWFRKAAEQGYAVAQFNLGLMYFCAWGVERDLTEAMEWVCIAAEQGFDQAQHLLGFMYYEGEGIAKDIVMAYMWLNLAAAQGHENAKENKGNLSKEMTKEQIAEAQKLSREWLAKRSK